MSEPAGRAGAVRDAVSRAKADATEAITGASSADALAELRSALGDRLLDDPASLAAYAVDSSRAQPEGLPIAVVRATSTDDVSTALAWAHARGIRVSVRGAGTGLSVAPSRTPAAWSSPSRR